MPRRCAGGYRTADAYRMGGVLHWQSDPTTDASAMPGPLDAGEWEKVHAHPQFTERVLRAAAPFAGVARLAAADHERIDGGGYPRGAAPSGAARILAAADLVQALSEPRPHRPAHPPERAAAIAVEEAVAGRLDRAAVNAVLEAAGQTSVRAAAPRGLTERGLDGLRLLARGQVDKEIAVTLGISHRTVHHHNQIYAAYGRGDMKYILDQLDGDVTWGIESVAAGEVPAHGILRGKVNVPKFFAAWAETADFHTFNPHDFIAAGDHVFNHLQYDVTAKATGKPVKNFAMQHWTFKNGKIVRWRGYEDTAATRDGYRK